MKCRLFLLFSLFGSLRGYSVCKKEENNTPDPVLYKSSVQPSDDSRPKVTLVALFPLHSGPNCSQLVCVKNYNGFQRMEAFVWAIDWINRASMKRAVFIETLIYDTCSDDISAEQPIRALEHARSTISKDAHNVLVGVVGASYSSVTQPLATATLALNLPLISYAASRDGLSKFPMFGRTLWSDDVQATAIADIIKEFQLTSFKVIGTEGDSSSYSMAGQLETLEAAGVNMCKTINFPKTGGKARCECERNPFNIQPFPTAGDPNQANQAGDLDPASDPDELDYNDLGDGVRFPGMQRDQTTVNRASRPSYQVEATSLHTLQSKVDAFVVAIKATTKIDYLNALKSIEEDQGRFDRKLQLIATDTWDISDDLSSYNISHLLEGSITIVPDYSTQTETIVRDHLKAVTNRSNILEQTRNPWLSEVWMSVSCCPASLDPSNCPFRQVDSNFSIDTKVENVINTVILFSEALEKYLKDCPGNGCLYGGFNGQAFFRDFIMTVDSNLKIGGNGEAGEARVQLDCEGNSVPHYGIFQFSSGTYKKIGTWQEGRNVRLNIKPRHQLTSRKTSGGGTECRPQCKHGEFTVYATVSQEDVSYDDCCYTCQLLHDNEIYAKGIGRQGCEVGTWPNTQHTFCRNISIEYKYDARSLPAKITVGFNLVYFVVIAAVAALLYHYRDHETVRKSGVHYFPFILCGGLLCQVFGICVFLLPFSLFSCFLLEMVACLGPTLCLSAILVKTSTIYTIFISTFQEGNNKSMFHRVPGLEPLLARLNPITRQMVNILALIMVQVLIALVWSATHNTHTLSIYPYNRHIQVCNVSIVDYVTMQTYNLVLLLVCTVYGFMTRNVRSDFNETRFISFSMFSTLLVMISGIVVIASIHASDGFDPESKPYDPELEAMVLSFMLSHSGFFIVLMMYTNKVYIIIKREIGQRKPVEAETTEDEQ